MQYRFLGKARLKVSAIGFGCPTFQGKLSDADAKRDIAIIHRAIDLGVNFIDTADHNDGNNEQLGQGAQRKAWPSRPDEQVR
jgi:aryl-alcohol dehydrogenase-like predicted oxidoreductase